MTMTEVRARSEVLGDWRSFPRTVICHCVECWARTSAVAFCWRHIFWPDTVRSGAAFGDDGICRAVRCHKIVEGETAVPSEDADVDHRGIDRGNEG